MNLREQLRQLAETVEERRADDELAAAEHERAYREEILPALRRVAEYFGAVVGDLETLEHSIMTEFPLGPANSPGVAFRQSGYRLYIDDSRNTREVAVTCNCELSSPLTRRIGVQKDADDFERRLRGMGLSYHRLREHNLSHGQSESSRFSVQGEMHSGFRMRIAPDCKRITLEMRNLEDRPTVTHVVDPQRLDEALLDTLGRLLLRERRFLFKGEMSAEDRERLSAEVKRLQLERESELAAATREPAGKLGIPGFSALKGVAALRRTKG